MLALQWLEDLHIFLVVDLACRPLSKERVSKVKYYLDGCGLNKVYMAFVKLMVVVIVRNTCRSSSSYYVSFMQ